MTWLWEEPVYIAVLGGVTVALLASGFMQTRSRALLSATLGAAALTGILLLVERWVETERERIDATLRRMALDVERNDLDAILSHVYSEATGVRERASVEFPQYEFTRVDIKRNLEVELDEGVQPPRAVVTFNVRVDLVELSTRTSFKIPRFVRLTLREEDGVWKVADYEHFEPQRSIMIDRER